MREPLRDLDLFAECTPAQIEQIRSLLTMLTVEPGTVLMGEGRFGFEFIVIADGEAAVSLGGRTVATLGAGDFVGEMSLLAGSPRSATVRAATSLTFYVANVAEFAGILEIAPGVADKITRTAAARQQANRQLAA
jgi:CRP/FNR family transcriptional regulator, cyclic AMP receptor protein